MFVYIPFCRESNTEQEYIYILVFFIVHLTKYFDFSESEKNPKPGNNDMSLYTVFCVNKINNKIGAYKKKISRFHDIQNVK